MGRPSVFRVFITDIIDFFIIASISIGLTAGIYQIVPQFTRIDLSFYFFEQYVELFFINHNLIVWLFGLSFGVTIIYFLFCAMLQGTTCGGFIMRLRLLDKKNFSPIRPYQAIIMGIGAFFGVLTMFIGPLWAWWLDSEHRGWSEKLAGTVFLKK